MVDRLGVVDLEEDQGVGHLGFVVAQQDRKDHMEDHQVIHPANEEIMVGLQVEGQLHHLLKGLHQALEGSRMDNQIRNQVDSGVITNRHSGDHPDSKQIPFREMLDINWHPILKFPTYNTSFAVALRRS